MGTGFERLGWDMQTAEYEKQITEATKMSEAKEILRALVKSPLFFAALVAFINALVLWLAPNVPLNVLAAGNALVGALGAVIASFYAGMKTPETLRALVAMRGQE